MTRFRIVALALGVVALLAVVALAARGAPMRSGAGAGSGPSAAFYDYAFTSVLILALIVFALGLAGAWSLRDGNRRIRPYTATLRAMLILVAFTVAALFAGRYLHGHHVLQDLKTLGQPGNGRRANLDGKPGAPARSVQFQWPELAVVLAVAVAFAVLFFVRRRSDAMPALPATAPETLAMALDQSLDDLRADPDLRRAIIAAYARMERALAAAGLPRRPSEAPLEYLERALLSLEASAGAVRRLTDLFEWARFSHHEPEPSMRDEAVDALVAVRDELRNPVAVAA